MSDLEKRNEWEKDRPEAADTNLGGEEILEEKEDRTVSEDSVVKEEINKPEEAEYAAGKEEQVHLEKEEEQAEASSERTQYNTRKDASKTKGFLSLLAAGVVGSALTFLRFPIQTFIMIPMISSKSRSQSYLIKWKVNRREQLLPIQHRIQKLVMVH